MESTSLCTWQEAVNKYGARMSTLSAPQRNISIFPNSMWKIHIKCSLCNFHPGLLNFFPVLWCTINLTGEAECVTSHRDNYYCTSVFNSHVEVCMLKTSASFDSQLEGPTVSCTSRPDLTQWLLLGFKNYSACFVTSQTFWRGPSRSTTLSQISGLTSGSGRVQGGNTIGFSLLFFSCLFHWYLGDI